MYLVSQGTCWDMSAFVLNSTLAVLLVMVAPASWHRHFFGLSRAMSSKLWKSLLNPCRAVHVPQIRLAHTEWLGMQTAGQAHCEVLLL